jgi:hypothetical protein
MPSNGERKCAEILDEFKIAYEIEKTFDTLIGTGGGLLRYDLFIPDLSLLIEIDGIQHTRPVRFGTNMSLYTATRIYEQTVIHDARKDDYAAANGYMLLRIAHTNYMSIERIVSAAVISEMMDNAIVEW